MLTRDRVLCGLVEWGDMGCLGLGLERRSLGRERGMEKLLLGPLGVGSRHRERERKEVCRTGHVGDISRDWLRVEK